MGMEAVKIQLSEVGHDYEVVETEGHTILQLSSVGVGDRITEAIKQTEKVDLVSVAGDKPFAKQILRCHRLVFQPNGTLQWDISACNGFFAISTDELVLNAPPDLGSVASIRFVAPTVTGAALTGGVGGPGPNGSKDPNDSGHAGTDGGHGLVGGEGKTFEYPFFYIFYKKIVVNMANPTVLTGLSIVGDGFRGGNGGKGGRGGNGGDGATGTPGATTTILFVKVCSAGPGRGGNGGSAGQGGKGGRAGKGGAGVSIIFVGPKEDVDLIDNIAISNNGGLPGTPGEAGEDGLPGQPGGGGAKPFECPNGGGNGVVGNIIPNPTKGPGDTNVAGSNGVLYLINRDNSDL